MRTIGTHLKYNRTHAIRHYAFTWVIHLLVTLLTNLDTCTDEGYGIPLFKQDLSQLASQGGLICLCLSSAKCSIKLLSEMIRCISVLWADHFIRWIPSSCRKLFNTILALYCVRGNSFKAMRWAQIMVSLALLRWDFLGLSKRVTQPWNKLWTQSETSLLTGKNFYWHETIFLIIQSFLKVSKLFFEDLSYFLNRCGVL